MKTNIKIMLYNTEYNFLDRKTHKKSLKHILARLPPLIALLSTILFLLI